MMKCAIAVSLLMLGIVDIGTARAGNLQPCTIEVLHSEFLAIAPLYSHTVKATLLVSAPGRAPFEARVVEVIPWQVPPPRQGQLLRKTCDPDAMASEFNMLSLF